jgi:ATP-dependent Clp protease adapter protein ClpS
VQVYVERVKRGSSGQSQQDSAMMPLHFSDDSVTPGASNLSLDSMARVANSEPVDGDLAAFINNPSWSLGPSAASDSLTSTSKRPLRIKIMKTGRKTKPSEVLKEEYEVDVPVHFSKPKAARKASKPKAPKEKKKVVYSEEEDSVSSVSSACAIISDVDSDATVIEDMPDEEDGEEGGEEVFVNTEEKRKEEAMEKVPSAEEKKDGDLPAFTCEFCGKAFATTSQKRQHISLRHRHEHFTTVTCPQVQCDQRFDEIEPYRSHCIETHGLYVCRVGVCTYSTDVEAKLGMHDSLIHRGEFRCSVKNCGHRAKYRRDLENHTRDRHTIFACPYCPKRFFGKLRLMKHKSKQHKNKCGKCGRWFISRSHLVRHQAKSKSKGSCTKRRKRIKTRKKAKALVAASEEPGMSAKSKQQDVSSALDSSVKKTSKSKKLGQLTTSSAAVQDNTTLMEYLENVAKVSVQNADAQVANLMNDAVTSGEGVKCEAEEPEIKEKRVSKKGRHLLKSWCRVCNKQLDSQAVYYNHLLQKHPKLSFPCDQCNVVYLRKEALTRHIKTVHEKFTYECSYCPETFTVANVFRAHSMKEHGESKPFICKQCDKRYEKLILLNGHVDVHHSQKREGKVCDKCGGTFLYLKQHQKTCLQLEQHLCTTCGEVSTSLNILPCLSSTCYHRSVHTDSIVN